MNGGALVEGYFIRHGFMIELQLIGNQLLVLF
jgi:hypothetical protein